MKKGRKELINAIKEDPLFFSTLLSILMISWGVLLVGMVHSSFGVFLMVIGGIVLYVSVIALVFKL